MCLTVYISPPFKFSLCWTLPTPATPAPAVFTSHELGSPCFKALPIRCKDAQLGTRGVVTQALCWREVRRLWCSQGSSGSFGCCTEEIESTMSWHRHRADAQRDCKQSGPGCTVRLLLLCFQYRAKGQKVILLLTICAKFCGKQPRAAEEWLLSLALAGVRHLRPNLFCLLREIRSKPWFPRCQTSLRETDKVTFPQGLWVLHL